MTLKLYRSYMLRKAAFSTWENSKHTNRPPSGRSTRYTYHQQWQHQQEDQIESSRLRYELKGTEQSYLFQYARNVCAISDTEWHCRNIKGIILEWQVLCISLYPFERDTPYVLHDMIRRFTLTKPNHQSGIASVNGTCHGRAALLFRSLHPNLQHCPINVRYYNVWWGRIPLEGLAIDSQRICDFERYVSRSTSQIKNSQGAILSKDRNVSH